MPSVIRSRFLKRSLIANAKLSAGTAGPQLAAREWGGPRRSSLPGGDAGTPDPRTRRSST